MNAHEFFRTRVTALVSHGFAVDAVRRALDLKGASEVWGGPATDDRPAWYFWLTSAPGAYRLRLVQAEAHEAAGGPLLQGVFSVKYYPSRCEPVFRRFSALERALIEGEQFDETNTPKLDVLHEIPESLFGVGAIEFTHDVRCGQSFLKYTSLDRMWFHGTPGDPEPDRLVLPEDAAPASRDRQLPAWDLGYPMFDAMAGLQAFLARRAPKRVILSRQPGFEFFEMEDGGFESRDSDQTALRSLLLTYFPADTGARSSIEEMITTRQRAEPWTPLLDTVAHWSGAHHHGHHSEHDAGCGHAAAHGDQPCGCDHDRRRAHAASFHTVTVGSIVWDVPLAFNEQWWALADAELAANTLPCGCH